VQGAPGSAVASTRDSVIPVAFVMAAAYLVVTMPIEVLTAPAPVRAVTVTSHVLGGLACAAVGWWARRREVPPGAERTALLRSVAALAAVVTATALVTVAVYRTPLTVGGLMLIVVTVAATVHVPWAAVALCAGVLASWFLVASWHAPQLIGVDSVSVLVLSSLVGASLHLSRRATVRRLEAARARISVMALTDELTGLGNRRAFFERGAVELEHVRRQGRPVALLYVDVDGLKAVNDAHGHTAGDRLIAAVALVLSGLVRTGDVVSRIGGDEFALLLVDCDEARAQDVCARLSAALDAVDARASCGLVHAAASADPVVGAVAGEVGDGPARQALEHLLAVADARMYEQKRARYEGPGADPAAVHRVRGPALVDGDPRRAVARPVRAPSRGTPST
jgi:diguanylate cyclase (GGDEF)-like protein